MLVAVVPACGGGTAASSQSAGGREGCGGHPVTCEQAVERFLDEWLAQPLFAGLDDMAAQRDERLRNTARGLASSLRLAGTGSMEPLWTRLSSIRMPVLLVTGERDLKFTAIARQMVALMDPHAWNVSVAEAGHSVHLEQPELTADVVTSWLRSHALV